MRVSTVSTFLLIAVAEASIPATINDLKKAVEGDSNTDKSCVNYNGSLAEAAEATRKGYSICKDSLKDLTSTTSNTTAISNSSANATSSHKPRNSSLPGPQVSGADTINGMGVVAIAAASIFVAATLI